MLVFASLWAYHIGVMQSSLFVWLNRHRKILLLIVFVIFVVLLTSKMFITTRTSSFSGFAPGTTERDLFSGYRDTVNTGQDMVANLPTGGSPDTQLIIQTGSLAIGVVDVEESNTAIKEIATSLGGFVTQATINSYSGYSDEKYGTIAIRVPAERFDDAVTQIKDIAENVASENITGKDVTEEYTDLQAQLRNLEATENELRELFDRTGSVEQILQVQRELSNVRGQIEMKKGRIQYLEESAALSSISVTLTETAEAPLVNEEWDIVKIARDAVRDLVASFQNLLGDLTYFAIARGPYLLIAGGVVFLIYRRMRK